MSHNGSESGSRLSGSSPRGYFSRKELNENNEKVESTSVHVDEVSSTVESGGGGGGDGPLDNNCGLLPNNCLPCLASTVDKKRSLSPGHPSLKKKMASKLSFKWREGQLSDLSLSEYSFLSSSLKMGNNFGFIQILVH